MNNKSILEAARNSGPVRDENETRVQIGAYLLAGVAMLLALIGLFLFDWLVENYINTSLIILTLIAMAVASLYDGFKNKKVWKIVAGFVLGLVTLFVLLAKVVL